MSVGFVLSTVLGVGDTGVNKADILVQESHKEIKYLVRSGKCYWGGKIFQN